MCVYGYVSVCECMGVYVHIILITRAFLVPFSLNISLLGFIIENYYCFFVLDKPIGKVVDKYVKSIF